MRSVDGFCAIAGKEASGSKDVSANRDSTVRRRGVNMKAPEVGYLSIVGRLSPAPERMVSRLDIAATDIGHANTLFSKFIFEYDKQLVST
jgi:hypothetical protein